VLTITNIQSLREKGALQGSMSRLALFCLDWVYRIQEGKTLPELDPASP